MFALGDMKCLSTILRCMSQKCQLLRQQSSNSYDALSLSRGPRRFPAGCATGRLFYEGQFKQTFDRPADYRQHGCICIFFSPPQGHLREGKCHLSLGNAMAASRSFQKVLELEPSNPEATQEVGTT